MTEQLKALRSGDGKTIGSLSRRVFGHKVLQCQRQHVGSSDSNLEPVVVVTKHEAGQPVGASTDGIFWTRSMMVQMKYPEERNQFTKCFSLYNRKFEVPIGVELDYLPAEVALAMTGPGAHAFDGKNSLLTDLHKINSLPLPQGFIERAHLKYRGRED